MKALHFANPLEFRVESPSDALAQGDAFAGSFQATHRGSEPVAGLSFSVALAYAEFKALKAKGEAALDPLASQQLATGAELAPGGSFRAEWEFALPLDTPITSKTGALFLIYGGGAPEAETFGRLDLPVVLAPLLEAFLGTLESQFSFAESGRKHEKGFTEVRLKPPDSYASMELLTLGLRHRDESVELVWRAKVKGFSKGAGGLTSRTVEREQIIPTDRLLMGGVHPNRPAFKAIITESIAELVPTLLQA